MTASETAVSDLNSLGKSPELIADRKWALKVIAVSIVITSIPYLYGLLLRGAAPMREWYSWLGYNLDDASVYLSWMRQAADGHFFQRNLFTTDPQTGHQFNLFFLALGKFAGLTNLPLLFVYHAARIVLCVALLRSIWWLLEMWINSAETRKTCFLVLTFAAGFGWIPGLWRHSGINSPVDVWQPESTTFLCLYLSPLFLVSLVLMVGVIGWLWRSVEKNCWASAWAAGGCGLLLGNIHTYDVITLAAVWLAYLIVHVAVKRNPIWPILSKTLIAGSLTAISTGHMLYIFLNESVFAKRVAVPTLSPPVILTALGFGGVLILAIMGVARIVRERRTSDSSEASSIVSTPSAQILVTWAIVNILVAYLPVAFNRKMLMGAHIPLAILAGIALHPLLQRFRSWSWTIIVLAVFGIPIVTLVSTVAASFVGMVVSLVIIVFVVVTARAKERQLLHIRVGAIGLLGITNVLFLARDVDNFTGNSGQSTIQRPYLYAGEINSLNWLREHATTGAPIQALPWVARQSAGRVRFTDSTVACFTPGLTGHPVNAGHWGETPNFGETMLAWQKFTLTGQTEANRRALLRQTGVKYVIFTQKHNEDLSSPSDVDLLADFRGGSPPSCLKLIPEGSSVDADVYEVVDWP